MALREKDKLAWVGSGNWYVHRDGCSISGTDPIWRDKSATPEQVMTHYSKDHEHDTCKIDGISWNEWTKVKRRVELLEVQRFDLGSIAPAAQDGYEDCVSNCKDVGLACLCPAR